MSAVDGSGHFGNDSNTWVGGVSLLADVGSCRVVDSASLSGTTK